MSCTAEKLLENFEKLLGNIGGECTDIVLLVLVQFLRMFCSDKQFYLQTLFHLHTTVWTLTLIFLRPYRKHKNILFKPEISNESFYRYS